MISITFEMAILFYAIVLSGICIIYIRKSKVEEEDSFFQKVLYYVGGPMMLPWLVIQPWICTFGRTGVIVSILTIAIYGMIVLFREAEIFRRRVLRLQEMGDIESSKYKAEQRIYFMTKYMRWVSLVANIILAVSILAASI